MDAQSLLASASINIGLVFIILVLFSIFKKQPGNAVVYRARIMSRDEAAFPACYQEDAFSFRRFLPSFEWVGRAFRVTEDELMRNCGLDALVVIRLFKFGIKLFVPCSVVGLLVLVPVNCTSQERSSSITLSYSIDSFTISNIGRGSNRLWVHFSCLYVVSLYALYLLYQEYRSLLKRRIQQLYIIKHRPDLFTILVRGVPFCSEHNDHGCSVDHFFSKHYPHAYNSYQVVYDEQNFEEELPAAFVSFNSRQGAALASQTQQHEDPLLWITEPAPEPRDVLWNNLAVPYGYLIVHRLLAVVVASVLTIFFAIPVTAVQGIAQLENIKKWFPPARAIQLIPGLSSIVTGCLPSFILNSFIYAVPYAMLGICGLQCCVSRSKKEMKTCSMVFYFLLGNVFFLSLLSGSLLEQIGESFAHPKSFPNHLATAVSSQADFFITYILTDGLSGFSLEILQLCLLVWHFIRSGSFGRETQKEPYLYSLPYYRVIPSVCICILIGMVYAVVAPFLLPFLVVYLLLGYVVYINQIQDVYQTTYETCGQYWPHIHNYIVIAIVLMQVTMIGLFGLKSKPTATILTIPLLVLTLLFNEYCKICFRPTFYRYSVQNAMENDELDEKEGTMEAHKEMAIKSYRQPFLRCTHLESADSSTTEPLVSSKRSLKNDAIESDEPDEKGGAVEAALRDSGSRQQSRLADSLV
ncbi:CSC1-like protein At3g54510 isoform X2 [Nymphaea colorata]|uniref:CSC1-like protein At3g54510 isoform X2 n=1 Tax=Nymphaea colorata TaxID=210225 RepID=UPI00129E1B04|nr:CSC1-like protein At3g54510 isoform X2 [Nymphaea colorata]